MIDHEQLLQLLGVPDIEIERVVLDEKNKVLNIFVKSTKDGCRCHCCGKPIDEYYGVGQAITLRHLPLVDYKTYLILKPKRYRCPWCHGQPTTTQTLSWYTPKSAFTRAYEQDILRALINSTIQDVHLKYDIGPDAIQGLLDRRIDTQINWETIPALEVMGIDEIALKKGHRDFVVIVSAWIQGTLTILAVLADRTKATVEEFFRSIPKRLRKTVKIVCSDLYAGFIGAVKAVFGKRVALCADRFHVARLYRDGLDSLRKSEMKRLRKILSKETCQSLKNVHWILRKSRDELTSDERRILNRLFQLSPKIREAYELVEALTAIYESPLSKGQGQRRIKGWMRRVANSKLTCFDSFLKTLGARMDEITNYFTNRQTSGFVEGLNNKIKVLKRRCYGITNHKHLFQRISLDLQGYALLA
jgi:transposase